MRVKVARLGDELVVPVPEDVVRDLRLAEGALVNVTTEARSLAIGRPSANGVPHYSLAELLAGMERLGPEAEPASVAWGPDRGEETIDDAYARGEITLDDLVSGRAAARSR